MLQAYNVKTITESRDSYIQCNSVNTIVTQNKGEKNTDPRGCGYLPQKGKRSLFNTVCSLSLFDILQ